MSLKKTNVIHVQNIPISIISDNLNDYINITDIAKAKESKSRAADIIKNWIRNRSTLEFIGTWEKLNNPSFKVVEFDHFRMQAGLPSFVLSPGQWIEKTEAIGIYVKSGRYGGTYAHKDIAFEFCSAVSPVFKLFLIKEFQRLKIEENQRLNLEWNLQRTLTKINYRIHTDAIKDKIIPPEVTREQANSIYASEADMLNVALFGQTAKQWREANPNKDGNIREHAELVQLNNTAITQMKSLVSNQDIKRLQ